MNKSMLIGSVFGGVIATATGSYAGYKMLDAEPAFADITSVTEVTRSIETSKQVCSDVEVTHQRAVKDDNRIAGSAIGAVLGGVLGNQVGGGNGKKIATVVGAAAGGYAGNKTQEHMQNNDTYTTIENQCQTVYDQREEVIGYDVEYTIGERSGSIRMDEKPESDKLDLANSELALASEDNKPS